MEEWSQPVLGLGRMEEWTGGGMEDWKGGEMEEWRDGGVEG